MSGSCPLFCTGPERAPSLSQVHAKKFESKPLANALGIRHSVPMDAVSPRIDLWLMPLNGDAVDHHGRWLAGLDDAERVAHDRHAKDQDRILYAASHALTRYALSQRFDADPSHWRFSEGPHGKPRIAHPGPAIDPRFNLSHTPGLVAVAITDGLELGLDVEALDPVSADLDTAHAFAHPAELRHLDPEAPDFLAAFYKLWTRKEALAKATGLGLSLEVRQLIFEDEIVDHWHLIEFDEGTAHRVALLAELNKGRPEFVMHRIVPEEMI